MRELPSSDYRQLSVFDCAAQHPWEDEVNRIVKRISLGGDDDGLTVRVAEHSESNVLMGVSAYHPRDFVTADGQRVKTMYILAIGVAGRYRGVRLPDGLGVGSFLMSDLLSAVRDDWADHGVALTWARIASLNTPSQKLVEAHEFKRVKAKKGRYDSWFRLGFPVVSQEPA